MHTPTTAGSPGGMPNGQAGAGLLVLGGTGWLSGLIAEAAVARGIDVTCLARGDTGGVPAGAQLVRADRTRPGAYDAVAHRDWAEIIDVTWDPRQARTAVAALADRAAHWTFVSSGAVHVRESAANPTTRLTSGLRSPDYPADKRACERAVMDGLGDRAAVIRVGLIGGAGDASDRTSYWPSRFYCAGGGPVLVPDAAEQPVRFIDGRDFAVWLATTAARHSGIFQAQGRPLTLGEFLASAARVAGFHGEWVRAGAKRLADLGVHPWTGPRSLPLWVSNGVGPPSAPPEDAEPMAPGLIHRPLDTIMRDTLRDEIGRGLTRLRYAGLTRDEELDVIARLRRDGAEEPHNRL